MVGTKPIRLAVKVEFMTQSRRFVFNCHVTEVGRLRRLPLGHLSIKPISEPKSRRNGRTQWITQKRTPARRNSNEHPQRLPRANRGDYFLRRLRSLRKLDDLSRPNLLLRCRTGHRLRWSRFRLLLLNKHRRRTCRRLQCLGRQMGIRVGLFRRS